MFFKNDKKTFDNRIQEAIEARKRLGLLRADKLSARTYIQTADTNSGVSRERLDEIEKVIESDPRFGFTRAFNRKANTTIGEGNCCRPVSQLKHLRGIFRDDFDAVNSELSILGCNAFAAFAISARQAAKKYPEAFGTVEDWDEHERELKDCEARLQDLYRQIEESWTKDDIEIVPAGHDRNGPVFRIFFKASQGAVSVGARNAGEALISHLLAGGKP